MKRNNMGFTLVEMLCTIVVMLLVSATVTVGIRLAVESYTRSITASESQVLCSTILDTVTDELRFGTVDDWGNPVRFHSDRYRGIRSFNAEGGKIVVEPDSTEDGMVTEKLLPDKSYPNGMRAVVETSGNETDKIVTVVVRITDSKGNKLIERKREVEILNVPEDKTNG